MSRLTRLEERRNSRKAVLLILGTIILLAMAVFLGIPVLVKMAVFLGDLKSSKMPVDRTDLIPPPPPSFSLPYDATNSANQTISGGSEAGSTVYLTLNGESVGNVVAKDDGTFTLGDLTLKNGDNVLVAIAIDQAGNKGNASAEVDVYYSNKPPELAVETSMVADNKVEIKGTTNGERLTANDRLIIIGQGGKFATTINLNPDEKILVLVVTDRAGNQTRKEVELSRP
ncbi:MAG: Ig-like domain-containing protein [Patescibacteria group bacterium]